MTPDSSGSLQPTTAPPLAPSASSPTGLDGAGRPWPAFAHGSEAEMARILDFYAVQWEYEPRTFPILWNLDGDVIESFSPDFYLPELGMFLELTTLKQRLVRKKNRKLRRLRELYPDIRIKLFYARDFRAILLKYGRLAFADALSGTLGQVTPDRAADLDPSLEIAVAEVVADQPMLVADAAPAPSIIVPAPTFSADAVPEPEPTAGAAAGAAEPGARRSTSRTRRRRLARAARAAAALEAARTAHDPHHQEEPPTR